MPSASAAFATSLRHLDVVARRLGVARGMIVHQDQRGGVERQRALDDLARIDRRVVDGAALLHLVGDQHVLAVEEEDAELLGLLVRQSGVAVVDELLPVGQHRHVLDLALGQPPAGLARGLEQHQRALVDLELAQLLGLGGEDVAQRAEALQQLLGQRLGVHALDRIEQQQLEQLVVLQQLGARPQHALAHPAAMAVIMRLRRRPRPQLWPAPAGRASSAAASSLSDCRRRIPSTGRACSRCRRLAQQQAVDKGIADDTPAILPGLDAQARRQKRAQRVVAGLGTAFAARRVLVSERLSTSWRTNRQGRPLQGDLSRSSGRCRPCAGSAGLAAPRS